jgi:hypothetical protein
MDLLTYWLEALSRVGAHMSDRDCDDYPSEDLLTERLDDR